MSIKKPVSNNFANCQEKKEVIGLSTFSLGFYSLFQLLLPALTPEGRAELTTGAWGAHNLSKGWGGRGHTADMVEETWQCLWDKVGAEELMLQAPSGCSEIVQPGNNLLNQITDNLQIKTMAMLI